MVASGRVKVVHVQSEVLVIITPHVGCSVPSKVVNVMSVSVVVLPVGRVRVSFSLVIQIHIILDIVLEVTFPRLEPVVSLRQRGELFMIGCLIVLVIQAIVGIYYPLMVTWNLMIM